MVKRIIFIFILILLSSFAYSDVNYTISFDNASVIEDSSTWINITFDTTNVYDVLNYNNTELSTTRTTNATHSKLTKQLTIPRLTKNTNFSFFWTYNSIFDNNFWRIGIVNDSVTYFRLDSIDTQTNFGYTRESQSTEKTRFYDDFEDDSINAALWATGGTNQHAEAEANGNLNLRATFDGSHSVSFLLQKDEIGDGERVYLNATATKSAAARQNNLYTSSSSAALADGVRVFDFPAGNFEGYIQRDGHEIYVIFQNGTILTSNTTTATGATKYLYFEANTLASGAGITGWNFSSFWKENAWGQLNGYTFNHGLLVNDTVINTTYGKYGKGAGFDGDGDYINASDDLELPLQNGTILYWIRPAVTIQSGSPTNGVFDKGTYISGRFHTSGEFYFSKIVTGEQLVISNQAVWTAGAWYHIALTWGTTGQKIYVNGTLDKAGASTSGLDASTNDFWIGRRASTYFNGSIDSFLIYNRTLSLTEIQSIYNNQTKYTPIGDKLIAQYTFENDNTTHTFDENNLVTGQYGEANHFDGVDDYINISVTPINTSELWTVSAWIYPLDTTSGTILNPSSSSGAFHFFSSSNNIYWRYIKGGGTVERKGTTDSLITSNTWHHIALFNNASNEITIYIDGTKDTTRATHISDGSPLGGVSTLIGRNVHAVITFNFNGSIDDVLIFNRSLSQKEIGYLYNHTYHANTTTNTQIVSVWNIDNCTLYSTPTINFTLVDEINTSTIRGDISGNLQFWRSTNTSYTKTFTFDLDNKTIFPFCINPSTVSLTGNYTITGTATSYQQRIFNNLALVFSNSLQETNLKLLRLADGIFARFKAITNQEVSISGVFAKMVETGQTLIIDSGSTDDSGVVTLFVNPDTTYDFTFSKSGYDINTFTLRVTTGDIFNIIMVNSTTTLEPPPKSREITYTFLPSSSALNNDTSTDFIFNLSSSYWNITSCTHKLKLNNGTILQSQTGSRTDTTCYSSITQDTNNYTAIISEAIYGVNSTLITVSNSYSIFSIYTGQFSLKSILDDLTAFGEAGFNDRTRLLIAFFTILIIVTVTSKAINIINPEGLIMLAWALVGLFSYVGWFKVAMSIPTIGGFELQKWIIFIVMSLVSGGYLIQRHTR